MLVFFACGEASKKSQNDTVHCDTLSIDEMYSLFNNGKNVGFTKLNHFDTTITTINTNKKKIDIKFFKSIDLTFSYYDGYSITPDNDREYFSLSGRKIIVDSLYYNEIPKDITFRTAGAIGAFTFKNNGTEYYAVFFENASCLVIHGTMLFLFSKNEDKEKLILSSEQLASNPICFGIDSTNNNLYFYEWYYQNGNINSFYNKYLVSNDSSIFIEKRDFNIEENSNGTVKFCSDTAF